MKISEIVINDFGGIDAMRVKPKMVNVLVGPNGSGKSSFLKALKYGLIGSTTRSNLVKSGALSGTVSLDIKGNSITRIINDSSTKLKFNGKITTGKSIVQFLQDECGATKDSMKFLASSEVFESLSASEFTEFLLGSGVIPLTIDLDTFMSIVNSETVLPKELEAEIKSVIPAMPSKFGLDTLGRVNDYYTDAIKSNKKELNRLNAILSTYDETAPIPKRSVEEVNTDLEKIVFYEATAKAYEETKRNIERIKADISRLQIKADAIDVEKPLPTTKVNLETTRDKLISVITKQSSLASGFEANNKLLKQQLERLDTERCPLSDLLVCTQDKTEVKKEIAETISANDMNICEINEDLKAYNEQLTDTKAQLNDYNCKEKKYNEKLTLLKQIQSLKLSMPAEPKTVAVMDYDKEKQRLNEELNLIRGYENFIKTRVLRDNQMKRLDDLAILEGLTSKKGTVKAKILKLVLSSIVEEMNKMADKVCPKLKLELDCDKTGNVKIYLRTATGLQSYDEISTGEKLMVQFLVMSQINQLSGFKVLVLDNLDKLDGDVFANFIKFLTTDPSVEEMFDNIFVATVNHKEFIESLAVADASKVNVINL